eukprot:62065-Alexandrium_andersonii.AAC.1
MVPWASAGGSGSGLSWPGLPAWGPAAAHWIPAGKGGSKTARLQYAPWEKKGWQCGECGMWNYDENSE